MCSMMDMETTLFNILMVLFYYLNSMMQKQVAEYMEKIRGAMLKYITV